MNQILVVVDMQNDFVSGTLGTEEAKRIVPIVVDKIKFAKEKGYRVFATVDTHFEETNERHDAYFETQEGKNLPILHCVYNTWGWELVDEVKELINRTQMKRKTTFGSLRAMETLKNVIEQENVETVEFCGLCTDICVIANVVLLKTIAPEVKIVVDSRACAGVTPKKHEAALEVMRSLQVQVI
ncbi:MAG: cysteine hydrolase [Clostridia bacterium]|nr:cysteine hydrolase [Clostridia bacterium]